VDTKELLSENLKKVLAVTLAVAITLMVLYTITSTVLTLWQMNQAADEVMSEQDRLLEKMSPELEIQEVKTNDTYILRVTNKGETRIDLENIDLIANGQKLNETSQEKTIDPGQIVDIETGKNTSQTEETVFEIKRADNHVTEYRCEYTENSTIC